MNTTPKYLVLYFIKETRNSKLVVSLRHIIFYNEEDLLTGLKSIQGNYAVYSVGAEYQSKSYFDLLFQEEKMKKDRELYEKLKQRFDK